MTITFGSLLLGFFLGSLSFVEAALLVGHRGTGEVPENTLLAMEKGLNDGMVMVEADVWTTADGEMVVIHDATVTRTTNGEGAVEDLTLAEIRALDAGSWAGAAYVGLRVPTVREVVRLVKEHGGSLILDIRVADPVRLRAIVDEEGLPHEQLGFLLWHGSLWRPYASQFPTAEIVAIYSPSYEQSGITLQAMKDIHGFSGLGLWSSTINQEMVDSIQAAGLHVHAVTENDPTKAMEFHRLGVDYIWTDRTSTLPRSAFDQWRYRHFGTPFLNELRTGVNGDPDHDGRSTLLEYAEGTDPLTWEQRPLTLSQGEQGMAVQFRIAGDRPDVKVELLTSPDFLNWSVAEASYDLEGTHLQGRFELAGNLRQAFFRLRVTRN